MQDWEFEVAEASGLPEYLALFEAVADQKDVRFTLADMIIQAFEETGTDLASDPQWVAFLGSLADDVEIHGSQIWYWASWDVPLNEAWNVAPFMRTLCKVHFAG